jgi:hypothetical protein
VRALNTDPERLRDVLPAVGLFESPSRRDPRGFARLDFQCLLKTLEHAGRGRMEKIASDKHAITDLIARGRKSQGR